MRLFVAMDITEEIRDRVADYIERMKVIAPQTKWVRRESLHITLKFIGESTRVADIQDVLSEIRRPAFSIDIRETGFFTLRTPRIFWAGVHAPEALQALAGDLDLKLFALDIRRNEHPYSPHLTLARTASGSPKGSPGDHKKPAMVSLKQAVDADLSLSDIDFGTMQAKEFFLYQSQTLPEGARYTKLARYSLA